MSLRVSCTDRRRSELGVGSGNDNNLIEDALNGETDFVLDIRHNRFYGNFVGPTVSNNAALTMSCTPKRCFVLCSSEYRSTYSKKQPN
ncbi:unnamed protein product [Albugo candida]|uniref:Uncharacterized protein n=1 Tax=Albugo candida TaxID=65357 RepID=A0A024G8S1_9STRA|nr:unnamed protein product [Albugo candida]|eukprot:CCI43158.1 unnamed protein product [Albugo candida]